MIRIYCSMKTFIRARRPGKIGVDLPSIRRLTRLSAIVGMIPLWYNTIRRFATRQEERP